MASKHKRRADPARRGSATALREEVDRLIAKGRLKDAVKEAKLCYREQSTPEHHRLMEQAYFLRAKQLLEGGMPSAAAEVAQHLLEFGVTDPALVEPAAGLLVAVGMTGRALELQARIDAPDVRERLARQAADQAVLHPERASQALAETREGAARVRAALEALVAGDEAKASAELRDVARNSPFSDWKLFVRGLAAFRRKEAAEAAANWERLDPGRAPVRVARALRSLDEPDPAVAPNFEALERTTFGEPILRPIRELGALIAEGRWAEAVGALRPLRSALRRVDPALAERLTRVLYSPVVREATRFSYSEAHRLLRDFTGAAEPLPLDPRWNRLWATAWEGPQGDIDQAETFWRKYLDDLKAAPALRPEERDLAQALVWAHLGGEFVHEASDLAPPVAASRKRVDPEVATARRRAVECLEESLRLCPTRRETYRQLMDAHNDWGEPERAAEVARRLLQALPDDFEALVFLADFHFRRDEPAESLGYIRRARALKPLDEATAGHEWASRVSLARHHAVHGRFDEGRAELAAAERLRPALSQGFHFLARKAALELKAGEADRAEGLITQARELLAEPSPLWLALRIEATRYKLPAADQDRFEALWVGGLSKKVNGETAGELANLIGAFPASGITYPGLDGHLKQVLAYLGRTTRIKYRREELQKVCAFLEEVTGRPGPKGHTARRGGGSAEARGLYEKLAKRGTKLFPDAPEFPLILGGLELQRGPFGGNLNAARKFLEKAVALAEAEAARGPSDPIGAEKLAMARKALASFNDLASTPIGLPFGPFPPGPGSMPALPADLLEAMFDDFGVDPDDDFLDDEDDFDEVDLPPRAPRPRGAGQKGKKKKKRRKR
jgi:tetratricopeptide (TPR) repeat protein